MLLAAVFALAAPGFFACQNAARAADDFTFFALLGIATAAFAWLHYGLVRHCSPLRRSVLVLIGAIVLLLVAIPAGAVIAFGGCGHFRM
jgi:hypothetical protein